MTTTNREFALTDAVFRKACEMAGVEPTKRQAIKFRHGKGRAYQIWSKANGSQVSQG